MIRLLRIAGFSLIAIGILVLVGYVFEPLTYLWRAALQLPLPILIGLCLAAVGLILLFISLLYERWQSRDADRALRDNE